MKLILVFLIFSVLSPGSESPQKSIPELIAKYEGWSKPNSLVHTLHNPGALSYAHQKGATRGPRGYAKWQTDDEGWKALDEDLQAKVRKRHPNTLRELLKYWNRNPHYSEKIAIELGIKDTTKITFILIPDVKWGWRIGYELPR